MAVSPAATNTNDERAANTSLAARGATGGRLSEPASESAEPLRRVDGLVAYCAGGIPREWPMQNVRVLAVDALAALFAAGCTPPPEEPPPTSVPEDPTEWLTVDECLVPFEGASAFPTMYHGPVDTRFNATGWPFLNQVGCGPLASGLNLGNIVQATTEPGAVAKCRSILEPDFAVLGAQRLDASYPDVPADAWIRLFG